MDLEDEDDSKFLGICCGMNFDHITQYMNGLSQERINLYYPLQTILGQI